MNALATWAFLIVLVGGVCVAVGAWWLSFHLDEEDDVERLLREDLARIKRDAALSKPSPWRAQ